MRTKLLDLGRLSDPTPGPWVYPTSGIICGGVHGVGGTGPYHDGIYGGGPVALEVLFAIPLGF